MKDVRTIHITLDVSKDFEIKNVNKLLKDVKTVLNSAHHLNIISEPIHKIGFKEREETVNESIIKNKLIIIDTRDIDEDGLRDLEFALANHCIDYKERNFDVKWN
jgi:ribosomal protein L10